MQHTKPRDLKDLSHKELLRLAHAMRDVISHMCEAMRTEPDKFTPPEDGDWLRASLEELISVLRASHDHERADKIDKIMWEPIYYDIEYRCDGCGYPWTDTHTCACDDDCPQCGATVSPRDWERTDGS